MIYAGFNVKPNTKLGAVANKLGISLGESTLLELSGNLETQKEKLAQSKQKKAQQNSSKFDKIYLDQLEKIFNNKIKFKEYYIENDLKGGREKKTTHEGVVKELTELYQKLQGK